MPSLRAAALAALCQVDPTAKARATQALYAAWQAAPERLSLDPDAVLDEPPDLPGRPVRPRLVAPKDVPTRSPFTTEGRAGLLHAIAHIEFNAIKIALHLGNLVVRPVERIESGHL